MTRIATQRSWLKAGPPLLLGLFTGLALVAGGAVWAALVPVSGALVVHGAVDGETRWHTVQHTEGGTVVEVPVQAGQWVEAGDLLMRLDSGLLDEEWHLVEAQIREAEARARRLRIERDETGWPADEITNPADAAQRSLYLARAQTLARQSAQLDQRRVQAEAELAGLEAQTSAMIRESDLIDANLIRHRALRGGGLISTDRLAALEREGLQLLSRLAALRARSAELRGQIAEIALQGETLRAARREEAEQFLAETSALLLELASRRAVLAERRERLAIRAPVAGRVHALAIASPGPVLAPGQTVAQIIPPENDIHITVRLRPDDVRQVYRGQEATVHLPAFAAQALPDLPARVADVAAGTLTDERSGLRYFNVTLELTEPGYEILGQRTLVPGMAVRAYVKTGMRTPLAYLLAPVRAQMGRALREQ